MALWADDRAEQLRQLRLFGYSAAECARSLGLSRNTVIGKLNRMGILHRPQTGPQSGTSAVKYPPYNPPMKEQRHLADEAIPLAQRCGVTDLDNYTCRWPVGDPKAHSSFFFCGEPTADLAGQRPYCQMHSMRALASTVRSVISSSMAVICR